MLGPASFVVLDTDYDNYALLCTCQQKDILFITFHRRSCTILQREPVFDPEISKKVSSIDESCLLMHGTSSPSLQMHNLLNDKIGNPSDKQKPDHDFDRIDHSNCNYADDGKGLQIDVDKILGSAKKEVGIGIGCCSVIAIATTIAVSTLLCTLSFEPLLSSLHMALPDPLPPPSPRRSQRGGPDRRFRPIGGC